MFKKLKDIAILPLNDALLFPSMVLPMHIYEKSYIKLIDYAMKTSKKIAITYNTQDFSEHPREDTVCCLASVTFNEDAILDEADAKAIVVTGIERVRIKKIKQVEPFIKTDLVKVKDTCSSQTVFRRCKENLHQLLIEYLFMQEMSGQDIHLANLIVDPAHIADFVAFYFIDDMFVKMAFLETDDVCKRCLQVEALLREAIDEGKASS